MQAINWALPSDLNPQAITGLTGEITTQKNALNTLTTSAHAHSLAAASVGANADTNAILNNLLVNTWLTSVEPFESRFPKGSTSLKALQALAIKCHDQNDTNRPSVKVDAIVLLISADNLEQFGQALITFYGVFPLTAVHQAQQKASLLLTQEQHKRFIKAAPLPKHWQQTSISSFQQFQHGSQLALDVLSQSQGIENQSVPLASRLVNLATKKQAHLNQLQQQQNDLNALLSGGDISGTFYSNQTLQGVGNNISAESPNDKTVAMALLICGEVGSLNRLKEFFSL